MNSLPTTVKASALEGAAWIKSSYSNNGGACVEAASLEGVAWIKSSYSNNGGTCVEAAPLPTTIALRDSKNPDGPALLMPPAAFHTFLTGVRDGRFSA
ncbi:DUF397 domain-containing protein [Streptomyces acidiscabies]|uniref:DUF397 domain-containing protein n=1 Tax=Streptomyces acidiscabies TaxID=42234 RepID=UPI0030CEBF42